MPSRTALRILRMSYLLYCAPITASSMERKKRPAVKTARRFGASDVTRTHDLLITNQLLYQLSYTSEFLTACTFYHKSLRMSTPKFDDY